jgi:ParB family transcriptional regulator, chromosome partitioning protein
MSERVTLLEPKRLKPNPDNPRLIFREDELNALSVSIAKQGILVPLTVYAEGSHFRILDGERRWRCALKLGLPKVPVIVQPKPDSMTNIMMMFAIHNARKDWDPLPTALMLERLEAEYTKRHQQSPTETELAGIASIPRGEVRRLKKLLRLPATYRIELLAELEKPRSQQALTVDHVLEASAGAEALSKREVIAETQIEPLRRAIVEKFRTKVIDSTVAPRKLANLARAVERQEVTVAAAKAVVKRLIEDSQYSIQQAYEATVERADLEHRIEQLARRLAEKLHDLSGKPSDRIRAALRELAAEIRRHV